MGNPSARVGDDHSCPMMQGTVPHVGGPILPPCHPTTTAGGASMARVGDKLQCKGGPPDFIVTGSATVTVGGQPAARKGDKTMHGGVVTAGFAKVLIGDATCGGALGNTSAGGQAFVDAATGRTSGSTQQSYQNCGVESARQIINKVTGNNIDENTLLAKALTNNWASGQGGTSPATRKSIMGSEGVNSTMEPQGINTVQQGVAEGKGVITSHDAGILWNNPQYNGGGHAVLVTGVEYDANGQLATVFINDTGTGNGTEPIPAQQFVNSLKPTRDVNVTTEPIW